MTNMDSNGAVIMPPTMGAAMRCMTSAPGPLDHMMGSKPVMTTATVIAIGCTRSPAPSVIASLSTSILICWLPIDDAPMLASDTAAW